jgi:hypothetical protein
LVRRAGLLGPLGPAAPDALRHLRYSRADTVATVRLLEAVPGVLSPSATAETVRRVVSRVGHDAMAELTQLGRNIAVVAGRLDAEAAAGEDPADPARDELPFYGWYAELSTTEDLSDLRSPLSGDQIMDHLGLRSGPHVGRLLDRLQQHRLVAGPFAADEAYQLLDQWGADNGC